MYSTENGSITVDRYSARFGPKSCAIGNINSVEVRVFKPNGPIPIILCVIFGVIMFVLSPGMNNTGQTAVLCLLGVGALAFAYWFYTKIKVREFQLYLFTMAGQVQAFVNRDKGQMRSLRDSIEAAMSGAGR